MMKNLKGTVVKNVIWLRQYADECHEYLRFDCPLPAILHVDNEGIAQVHTTGPDGRINQGFEYSYNISDLPTYETALDMLKERVNTNQELDNTNGWI